MASVTDGIPIDTPLETKVLVGLYYPGFEELNTTNWFRRDETGEIGILKKIYLSEFNSKMYKVTLYFAETDRYVTYTNCGLTIVEEESFY